MGEIDTICYHHNDPDGIFAGAVVKLKYPEATMVSVNYGMSWKPEDVKGKRVFVVDFSFPNMRRLFESCAELIWCDHHKTAMDENIELWNDTRVKGLRSMSYAGCVLTYAYLNNIAEIAIDIGHSDLRMPLAIQYVGIYDMWQHKQGDVIDAFVAAAYMKIKDPSDKVFNIFLRELGDERAAINEYISIGTTLIDSAMNQVRKIASREELTLIKLPNKNNITMFMVNSTSEASRLGSYINDELQCDIAIMYEIVKDKKNSELTEKHKNVTRVSLRSKTVNVSVLALMFGGGGHRGAAGFETELQPSELRDEIQAKIYRAHSLLVEG
jgi:oligoribonuclease NrnB/cAMP/cGMP phosphodiesterase (DHH superfamily)